MRTLAARKLLSKHCRHAETWHCGRATASLTGKDRNPAFDRRLYIYLSQTPAEIDPRKIARLLNFLDRLGRGKEWPRLTSPEKQ